MNILRRLPLSRLLLMCGVVIAAGVSGTALALALGSGPTPPARPLAVAVHDALAAPAVEGVSATVHLRNHLLEGANLASGGDGEANQLSASPLLTGASGRLWVTKDGRVRLELQSEKGDTQVMYDGHTLSAYDAATNTLYRYKDPVSSQTAPEPDHAGESHEAPSVAKVEEAISHLREHASVSGAQPTDIAGQPAYTVRVAPKEGGSLLGGAELSFDAVHGIPLRAAIYSTDSSTPVIELAASAISYGPIDASVFSFTPPAGAKVQEITAPKGSERSGSGSHEHPEISTSGHGLGRIAVIKQSTAGEEAKGSEVPEGLPKVDINGTSASELATPLGTLLSFERSGVRYLLVGSVTPAAIEAVARGL
jgi:outer membrane lipoprotein-sorting protein